MNKRKMEKLKAAGWKVGNAEDFLGLSKEETALVEIKVALPPVKIHCSVLAEDAIKQAIDNYSKKNG